MVAQRWDPHNTLEDVLITYLLWISTYVLSELPRDNMRVSVIPNRYSIPW